MKHLIEKAVVQISFIDRKDKFLTMTYDKHIENKDGTGEQWWLNERQCKSKKMFWNLTDPNRD